MVWTTSEATCSFEGRESLEGRDGREDDDDDDDEEDGISSERSKVRSAWEDGRGQDQLSICQYCH